MTTNTERGRSPRGDRNEAIMAASILDGEGGARRLGLDAAARYKPEEGVLWVHLDLGQPTSRVWLTELERLPAAQVDALLRTATRTRVEPIDDDRLLLALRLAPMGGKGAVSVRALLAPARAVTLSHGRLAAVEAALGALQSGHGPRSVPEIVAFFMEHSCREAELTRISFEEELASEPDRRSRDRWCELQRVALDNRRGLARQRTALVQMAAAASPWLIEDRIAQWQELSNRTEDLVDGFDEIVDGLRARGDQRALELSATLDHRVQQLTSLCAILLPLAFVASLFGVNLGGVPGRQLPWAFAVLCVGLTVTTLVSITAVRSGGSIPRG